MSKVVNLKVITRSEKDYHDKKIMELTIAEQEKEIKLLGRDTADIQTAERGIFAKI